MSLYLMQNAWKHSRACGSDDRAASIHNLAKGQQAVVRKLGVHVQELAQAAIVASTPTMAAALRRVLMGFHKNKVWPPLQHSYRLCGKYHATAGAQLFILLMYKKCSADHATGCHLWPAQQR